MVTTLHVLLAEAGAKLSLRALRRGRARTFVSPRRLECHLGSPHGSVLLARGSTGTGYSSLAYLPRLPVIRTVVGLGRHLGLKVVAEGVEDAKTWDLLASARCDLAPGYDMARAMPAADLARRLGKSEYGLVKPVKGPSEE